MCDKIESFLEEISSLPRWLNRSLSLLRDLDLKSQTSGERAQHHRTRYLELARARLANKRHSGQKPAESAIGFGEQTSSLYDDPELQAEAAEAHKLGREAQALMREKVIVLNQVLRVIRGEAESFKCSLAKLAREVGEEFNKHSRKAVAWGDGATAPPPPPGGAQDSVGLLVTPSSGSARAVSVKSSSSLQQGAFAAADNKANNATAAAAATAGAGGEGVPTPSSSDIYRPLHLNLAAAATLGGAHASFGAAASLRQGSRAVKRHSSRTSPASSTVDGGRLGKRARLATTTPGEAAAAAHEFKKAGAVQKLVASSAFGECPAAALAPPPAQQEASTLLAAQESGLGGAPAVVGGAAFSSRAKRHRQTQQAQEGLPDLALPPEGVATTGPSAPTEAYREALHQEQQHPQQTAKHSRNPTGRFKKQARETPLADIAADSAAAVAAGLSPVPAEAPPLCGGPLGAVEVVCRNPSRESLTAPASPVQPSAVHSPGVGAQQQLSLSKSRPAVERGKNNSRAIGARASVLRGS